MKSLVKKLMLFGLGLTTSLAAGEIGLRIFFPQPTFSRVQTFTFQCFEEGEHRWIKLRKSNECLLTSLYNAFEPVMVKTNSFGQRSPEIEVEKPSNTKRLLFIGDSFTMGWGVREEASFPRVTESILNKRFPQRIEAINAGFTAAGPSGYFLSLKLDGMKFDPDIVLVGFYLGNDIISRKDVEWVKTDADGLPNVVRSKTSYIDGRGQLRLKESPVKYRIPILRESHFFIFLMNLLLPLDQYSYQKEIIEDIICAFNRDCHQFDQGKAEIKRLFLAMDSMLRKKNKRLVVILIPTNFQVHFDIVYQKRYNLPFLPSERRFLNDEFLQFFEENDIDSIDLLPALLEKAGQNRLYFDQDDHWNQLGHRQAAEAIAQKLVPYLQ